MSYVIAGVELGTVIGPDPTSTQTTTTGARAKDATAQGTSIVQQSGDGLTAIQRIIYSDPVRVAAMLAEQRRRTQAAIDRAKADAASAAATAQAEYDALKQSLTTPNMKSWTEVSVAYNRLIEQMKLAFVMWGAGDWAADVNAQVIPGSNGADTVGGFTNGTMPAFIGGDFSQGNRIINRCHDLATNSRATPEQMRQVAGALEKMTRDIVQAVFDGTLKVGQDPAPPAGGGLDYGGGDGGGGEEAPSGLPGWVLPAVVVGAILLLRRK